MARPCLSKRVMKNGRCRMHSGGTAAGIASPNWKDGRWAKDIQNRPLRERFYSALSDRQLISLKQNAALLDALIADRMAHVKAGKVTAADTRDILGLTEAHRMTVEAAARMEQRIGKAVPVLVFRRYVEVQNQAMRLVATDTDTGVVDLARLKRVTPMLDAAYTSIEAGIVDGEIIDDDKGDADGEQETGTGNAN